MFCVWRRPPAVGDTGHKLFPSPSPCSLQTHQILVRHPDPGRGLTSLKEVPWQKSHSLDGKLLLRGLWNSPFRGRHSLVDNSFRGDEEPRFHFLPPQRSEFPGLCFAASSIEAGLACFSPPLSETSRGLSKALLRPRVLCATPRRERSSSLFPKTSCRSNNETFYEKEDLKLVFIKCGLTEANRKHPLEQWQPFKAPLQKR